MVQDPKSVKTLILHSTSLSVIGGHADNVEDVDDRLLIVISTC